MELENAVSALSKMHGASSATMATNAELICEGNHPNLKVDLPHHANTSYGHVSFEDLAKFVVDRKPLEFKEKDKEFMTEVHPDGTEIKKVVDKEKKTIYVAPYKVKAQNIIDAYLKGVKYFD